MVASQGCSASILHQTVLYHTHTHTHTHVIFVLQMPVTPTVSLDLILVSVESRWWTGCRALCRQILTEHLLCVRHSSSVQFSRSVVSDSLRPHELQHTRPPCSSPSPGVHSNSCPSMMSMMLSRWCHPVISSSVIPFSCPQYLPASESSNESALHMRWPKYWSFSFSIIPSKEHPGLISFRMDWLDLLAVQGTLKSLLQHCSSVQFSLVQSLSCVRLFATPWIAAYQASLSITNSRSSLSSKASILRRSAFFTLNLSLNILPYSTWSIHK